MKNIDETISIPEKYINNYDDFERLNLSNKEVEIYRTLNKLSLKHGKEAIKITYKDGETDFIISNKTNRVDIPIEINDKEEICIYHSHTNITPLSRRDIVKLFYRNIKKIGCITINGDIFEIEIGNGYIPDNYEEFDLKINSIYNEVGIEISSNSSINNINSDNSYLLIRETMYRISRYYKLTLKGGNINE